MVLEKTLESPLECKEIQPVHPKGDQSWVFIGKTNIEAQGYPPVLLENLCGMSCSGTCWPLGGAWFQCGMEAFDELLLINVPWSQEFSGVP